MDTLEIFNEQRPYLFSIAYRMLGSVSDAEDMLQETFLRWHATPPGEVKSPRAYLSTIITRLCLDQLKSAKARHEVYPGTWLPEPLFENRATALEEESERRDSLSLAFLFLLEKLSPPERAAFLLREVFGYEYEEVAEIIGKSPSNCRQMVSRARQYLHSNRPRFPVSPEKQRQLVANFVQATSSGNMEQLLSMLREDVVSYSDGGGKVAAALNPVVGAEKVMRLFVGLMRKAPPDFRVEFSEVNGQPALAGYMGDKLYNVITFEFDGDRISRIMTVSNPDKLHLA
jgi:RNA polymerase sigma-70 factor (ECF subfamily)